MTAEDYSLKRFASHPFYTAMNRRLVKLCELRPWQRVVDLGCGTGAVTELILEEMHPDKGEVVGVDPSPCALEVARRDLQERWGAVVKLMAGQAENLSRLVKRAADAVVFCATRPPHVNVSEMIVMPTAQASTMLAHRKA